MATERMHLMIMSFAPTERFPALRVPVVIAGKVPAPVVKQRSVVIAMNAVSVGHDGINHADKAIGLATIPRLAKRNLNCARARRSRPSAADNEMSSWLAISRADRPTK